MKRNRQSTAPTDLGSASRKTLGGNGRPFDLVKDIPAANGIVE